MLYMDLSLDAGGCGFVSRGLLLQPVNEGNAKSAKKKNPISYICNLLCGIKLHFAQHSGKKDTLLLLQQLGDKYTYNDKVKIQLYEKRLMIHQTHSMLLYRGQASDTGT